MKYRCLIFLTVLWILMLCPMTAFAEESCEHAYGEWVLTKTPTCTEQGEVSRTCERCGEVQTASVAMTAHTEGDWTLEKAPEVGVAGGMQKACTVCGTVLQTQELAALPEPEPETSGQSMPEAPTVTEPQEQPWIEVTLPVAICICLLPNLVLVVVLLVRKIRRKIASNLRD